ncbi:MAG: hypothetical protein ABDI07_12085, partial [Candidatus Kryptonium sp.]
EALKTASELVFEPDATYKISENLYVLAEAYKRNVKIYVDEGCIEKVYVEGVGYFYKFVNPARATVNYDGNKVIVSKGKNFVFIFELKPTFEGEVVIKDIEPEPLMKVVYETEIKEGEVKKVGKGIVVEYEKKPDSIEVDFLVEGGKIDGKLFFWFSENENKCEAYLNL